MNVKWIFLYYLILSLFEFILMPLCIVSYQLMSDIRSGSLDIYLIRPMNYLQYQFFDKSGNLIMLFFLACISSILTETFPDSLNFYLTIYYFIVAAAILFELFALIGILAFTLENVLSIRDNMWNIIKLFSGALITLSLYPDFLKNIVDYLPFRYIYFVPINTLLGGARNPYFDFVMSFIWLLILFVAVKISWYLGIKNYSSQGG